MPARRAICRKKVVDCIRENDFVEQCVVTSTSLSYLKRVKAADPDIYTGYILSAAYGSYYEDDAIDFISLISSSANRKLIERVHACGKEVHVWTVNKKSELERMKMIGVDNIITDGRSWRGRSFWARKMRRICWRG